MVRFPWPTTSGFRWEDTHVALWPKEPRDLLEDKLARPNVLVVSKRKIAEEGSRTVAGGSSWEGEEPRQQRPKPVEPTIRAPALKRKKIKRGKNQSSRRPTLLGSSGTKGNTFSVSPTKSLEVQHPPKKFVVVESHSEAPMGQDPPAQVPSGALGVGSTSAASNPKEPQIAAQGGASRAGGSATRATPAIRRLRVSIKELASRP